jgi:protease I
LIKFETWRSANEDEKLPMAQQLTGKRVAIVVTDGFEQDELEKPRQALEEAGARTEVVSPKSGKVKGWKYTDWGKEVAVDRQVREADPEQYDALMLPGGQMSPDNLRLDKATIQFIESFVRSGKPIAAICHGPLTLIEADGVRAVA